MHKPHAPFDVSTLLTQEPFNVNKLEPEEMGTPAAASTHDHAGTGDIFAPKSRRIPGGGNIPAPQSTHSNHLQLDEPAKPKDAPEVAEDTINPSHYRKHPSGIECIEVTRHMNFNAGNAVKYIWRYLDKGDPVENLKKAQWYLDDEIRRLEGKR
jgi:hypothetical protein